MQGLTIVIMPPINARISRAISLPFVSVLNKIRCSVYTPHNLVQ